MLLPKCIFLRKISTVLVCTGIYIFYLSVLKRPGLKTAHANVQAINKENCHFQLLMCQLTNLRDLELFEFQYLRSISSYIIIVLEELLSIEYLWINNIVVSFIQVIRLTSDYPRKRERCYGKLRYFSLQKTERSCSEMINHLCSIHNTIHNIYIL